MRTDGAIITNAGLELISYAIANNKSITFTKTKLGKGDVNTFDEAKKLTDVVSFYKQIPITSISRNNAGVVRVRSTFSNEGFPVEVVLKEVGIFATVEGKSETLFAYVNDGAGESFPPGSSGNVVERIRDIYVGVSTALEVNATIDKSVVYATMFDLEEGLNKKEDKFTKNSGFNKNKSDSTSLDDSDTLATSKAVKLTMEKATEASNAAAEKEPKFDKNTAFNKKFGVVSGEVLEGHRMAQIQGVEKCGGDVQTPGVKKVGYSYWCTANKDFYVCKVENSLNYIDSAYFDAFSNYSLLGKLQNLGSAWYHQNIFSTTYPEIWDASCSLIKIGNLVLCCIVGRVDMINGKSSKVSIPLNFRPSSDKLTNVNGIAQIIIYKDGVIKISGMSNTTNIVTLTYVYSL